MLSMIYGRKKRRAISSCMIAVLVVATIAGAVISAPVCVMALSAGGLKSTIASIIISLMLQAGVAPTNTSWLTSLNSSYGYTIETAISEGLLTESAGTLIDTGLSSAIESATAYTELGLSDIFTTTATDIGVEVASAGVNLTGTAINVGTLGTIGAFAGASVVGVGIGVLANHLITTFGDYIKYGAPLTMKEIIENGNVNGGSFYYFKNNNYGRTFSFVSNNVIGYKYLTSSNMTMHYVMYSLDSGIYDYTVKDLNNKNQITLTNEYSQSLNAGSSIGNQPSGNVNSNILDNYYLASSSNEINQIIRSIINGEIERPHHLSPDITGPLGNQYFDSDNDNYPGIESQIPDGHDMIPVDMNDYNNYIENANQNTEDGNTDENIQGTEFINFINPYIVNAPTIPDTPIIPDENVNVPTVPERPVEPSQPTIPDKPDIGQSEIDEALQGATTIDLRSVFPFCIPFDLYNLILIFDTGENRRAPHINFTFPGTNWNIDVDLAPFDTASGILRLLELIVFIVGLAVATRKLIGAGG